MFELSDLHETVTSGISRVKGHVIKFWGFSIRITIRIAVLGVIVHVYFWKIYNSNHHLLWL